MNYTNCLRIFSAFPNKIKFTFQSYMEFSTKSHIKTIELKTCGQLYEKLRRNHPFLYRNSPTDGLAVTLEYVDTLADSAAANQVKTILAIHGNPGNHQNFSGLIDYFKDNSSVRVIAPNMPNFGLTRKTMAFWHSNEERVQLIKDFLKAINVNEIDCLVSHSAGIHPQSLMWSEPDQLKIKGVGIFCPQYPRQRFFRQISYLSFLAKYKFWIAIMDWMRPDLMARGRFPLAFANVDEFLYFLIVHSTVGIPTLHQRMDFLKSTQSPTLLVYGENDKLIKKESFERFYQRLGADFRDVVLYSENKTLEKDSQRNNWIKVLALRGGGHFAHEKYSKEVAKHLVEQVFRSKL